MSRNLSRTLFYEFHKSDPNLIYESVEEYRNYKSDPNFTNRTIEEYRRIKALEKKEILIQKSTASCEEEYYPEESQNDVLSTTSEKEIQTVNDIESNLLNASSTVVESTVDETEREFNELKVESMAQQVFERSLEQFWNSDEEDDEAKTFIISKTPSACSSNLSIFTELHPDMNKKKAKSKFKIPKTRSTINFNKVKSRYMNVFKKRE